MAKSVARWAQQIWFPVGLGVILRLIQLQAPILGIHSWRQADTAAMARHFALEGTPIWLPQIDWSGASPGYVECEFPLLPAGPRQEKLTPLKSPVIIFIMNRLEQSWIYIPPSWTLPSPARLPSIRLMA